MVNVIHLENPPIVEAVIEIQVNGTKESFQQKIPEIEQAYKVKTDLESHVMDFYQHQIGWQGSQVSASSNISPKSGLQFLKKSTDKKNPTRIITVQPDKFSISWLETYKNWNAFFNEAWSFWEEYQKILIPRKIIRIGVRFINKIALNGKIEDDLKKLLVAPPLLNHLENCKFLGYLTKHLFEDEVDNLNVHISQLIEKQGDQNILIIDHDVFHTSEINTEDEGKILSIFTTIHKMKDRVFWGMIREEEFKRRFNQGSKKN